MTLEHAAKQIRVEIEGYMNSIEIAEEWHIRYVKRLKKSSDNLEFLKTKKFELERQLHRVIEEQQKKINE